MSDIMKKPKNDIQNYKNFVSGIQELLEAARHQAARAVNAILTATYWEIGRRIVEYEQGGKVRAEYGEELLKRLSQDLSQKFGRGFAVPNLERFRSFYLQHRTASIPSTMSRESSLYPRNPRHCRGNWMLKLWPNLFLFLGLIMPGCFL